MLKYLMLMAILTLSSFMHPMHVSVCEIKFDRGKGLLEFTHHIFIDDLEKSIRIKCNEPFLDITKPDNGQTTDQLVKAYLADHFKVNLNGKDVLPRYLGYEVENDAIYCFMEVAGVEKIESVRIFNDTLTEIYKDQVNLVNIEVDDEIRSMKLSSGQKMDILRYNN